MDMGVNSIVGVLNSSAMQTDRLNGASSAHLSAPTRIEGEAELSAAKKFEAMVMSQMVADIMPKDSEYFGDGFSGDVWRSMMSEQLGELMVRSTDFGIAELISRDGSDTQKASK